MPRPSHCTTLVAALLLSVGEPGDETPRYVVDVEPHPHSLGQVVRNRRRGIERVRAVLMKRERHRGRHDPLRLEERRRLRAVRAFDAIAVRRARHASGVAVHEAEPVAGEPRRRQLLERPAGVPRAQNGEFHVLVARGQPPRELDAGAHHIQHEALEQRRDVLVGREPAARADVSAPVHRGQHVVVRIALGRPCFVEVGRPGERREKDRRGIVS